MKCDGVANPDRHRNDIQKLYNNLVGTIVILKNIFKSNKVVDTPFEEGGKAFWNDMPATRNPYKHSDEERMQQWEWDLGWKNGQRNNEKLKWTKQNNTEKKKDIEKQNDTEKKKGIEKQNDTEWYPIGAIFTAIITFVGSWIYCIATYGFLLGVGLGWLPSIIVAVIAGFLWPLIAIAIVLAIAVIAYLIFKN